MIKVCELIVNELGDRLEISKLLIKNGYTVGSGKRKKNPSGKTYEYYLVVYKDETNEEG